MSRFSDHLRAARESSGLSQAEAARQAGVPQQTWNSWETGKAIPTVDRLGTILTPLAPAARRAILRRLTTGH